jgi:coenzyme Q-binding protein COQ10
MTSLRRSLELPFRPEQLYELAADVGRYPDFIKWIKSLRLLSEEALSAGWKGRAETTVRFMGFNETFVSDVDARRPDAGADPVWAIDVTNVRGPFRKLKNTWRFWPAGEGSAPNTTKVEFFIEFEFRNFVLQAVADANRDYAVGRIIEAFTDEAEERFGRAET